MKLSEAMKLGAMLKPQARYAFYEGGRTCALGASVDALGRINECKGVGYGNGYAIVESEWPYTKAVVAHPLFADIRSPMWRVIEDLNDTCQWPREQIADWVATIEQQQDAAAAKLIETPVPLGMKE